MKRVWGRGESKGGRGGLAVFAVLASGWVACDDGPDLSNRPPVVTQVALEALDEGRAALTLWVKDVEGDAVDVTVTWSAGGQSGSLVLAPGSAPLLGVPTELALGEVLGQPHRVLWDLSGVAEGAATLALTVDDRPHAGSDGDTYRTSEGIDPRVGGGPVAAVRDD